MPLSSGRLIPGSQFSPACNSQLTIPVRLANANSQFRGSDGTSLQLLAVSFLIPSSWLRAQLLLPASRSPLTARARAQDACQKPILHARNKLNSWLVPLIPNCDSWLQPLIPKSAL